MSTNEKFKVISITHLNLKDYEEQIREVFYSTSSIKDFSNAEEKENFYRRWTDYYYQAENSQVLAAIDSKDKIKAYLMGTNDSLQALNFYKDKINSYKVFAEHFNQFPAHFHINTKPCSQRLGLGRTLIDSFCHRLIKDGVKGVHIVTTAQADNIAFYHKNDFLFEVEKPFRSLRLCFLGRKL